MTTESMAGSDSASSDSPSFDSPGSESGASERLGCESGGSFCAASQEWGASAENAQICFDFEAEFTAQLRCIPMAVRRKLDLAGVKLKLVHWSDLAVPERQRLLEWPDGAAAIADLRLWLLERTAQQVAGMASTLPVACQESWQQDQATPRSVQQACKEQGVLLQDPAWGRLIELQRFALVKLSQSGHEHRNLPLALVEFGLTSP